MFDWKSAEGENIVEFVNNLRKEGMRNWEKIAARVNDNFDIDFHQDKIRKGWRMHGTKDPDYIVPQDKSEFKIEYNTGEATASGRTIKTLEDLIKACEINLDIWKIDKHVVNKWDVKAKTVPVFPLFQVKAWLSKRVPDETVFPVIAPIKVSMPKISKPLRNEDFLDCALVIPDSQIGFKRNIDTGKLTPFHDRRAMDLAVQIANYTKPKRIVLLGDMIDLPDWSDKFLRSPEMYWTTQPSLLELAWWIARLIKAVPDVHIDYLEGNHENRIGKMIIGNLIAAYNLKPANNMSAPPVMSIQNLLGLKDLGVAYHDDYPHDEIWINEKLRCRHGNIARKGGGVTSRTILRDTFVSEIYGHVHRFEYTCKTVKTVHGMETFRVFSPGTIAKIDGSVPSNAAEEDWQQGLGLVYYNKSNFNINPISISEGTCIFDGRLFEGVERVEELKEDTSWLFF